MEGESQKLVASPRDSGANAFWDGIATSRLEACQLKASFSTYSPTHRSELLSRFDDEEEAIRRQISTVRARRNAILGAVSLPADILTYIFSLLATLEHGEEAEHFARTIDDKLGWIRATHVCQRWRNTALGCPILWTEIDTALGDTGSKELFARSRDALLSVYVTSPPSTGLCRLIAENLPRTRVLCIDRTSSGALRAFGFLLQMLTRPAPSLEVFQIVDSEDNADEADLCYPANFLGGCAPRLRSFYSDTFEFGLWASRVLDNVATLDINCTVTAEASSSTPLPNLDDVFAALERMRALTVLYWYEHLPRSNLLQDSPVRKVVSLPGLTHLSFGGELAACAQLLRHIDVPSTTRITFLPLCLTSSEADLATFFHHTTSWLSRHAPFSPSAVSISTVKEEGVAVANKYIKLLAWHAVDIEVDSPFHDDDDDDVPAADLTIWFEQGPKDVLLAWDDIQMVKACYGVCASMQLRQLSLCADEWQQDAWREILGAPAAAALWRVVALRAAATELLSFWRVCEPRDTGATLRSQPALVTLCLSKPNGKPANKTFVKHLAMLPYWLAQRANAGYPLKKLELDFEVDQAWRSSVEGSVDMLRTDPEGERVSMSQ